MCVRLFIVLLVRYKKMFYVRLAGDHLYGNSCSPGVAGDVFDGCPFPHEMSWM